MKKTVLAIALCTFGLAGTAVAGHCPKDAQAITTALGKSMADAATKAKIGALRDEGMALHKAGDHRKSEATLAEAMRMLLTN